MTGAPESTTGIWSCALTHKRSARKPGAISPRSASPIIDAGLAVTIATAAGMGTPISSWQHETCLDQADRDVVGGWPSTKSLSGQLTREDVAVGAAENDVWRPHHTRMSDRANRAATSVVGNSWRDAVSDCFRDVLLCRVVVAGEH